MRRVRQWLARFAAEASNPDQPLNIHRTTVQVGGRTFILVHTDFTPDYLSLEFREKDKFMAQHTVCRKCPTFHVMSEPHDG